MSASKATPPPSDPLLVNESQGAPPTVVTTLGRRSGLRIEERKHLILRLGKLTPREREVAYAVFLGGDNEAIASRLCIALPTLRTHLMRINQKLGTSSKSDVVQHVAMTLLDGYRSGAIKSQHEAPSR